MKSAYVNVGHLEPDMKKLSNLKIRINVFRAGF